MTSATLPLFPVLLPLRNVTPEPSDLYEKIRSARKRKFRVTRHGRHVVLNGRRLTWAQFDRLFPTVSA